jgi:rod shape-determining protein MreD
MRRLAVFVLAGLAVILQLSLLPALRMFGVVPNLVLVVVVLIALNVATSEALLTAAVSGLVIDLASGTNFGLWMGALMLVTLVVSFVGRAGIELDGVLVALVLVGISTAVMTLAVWLPLITGVSGLAVPVAWGGRLATELVINLILTIMLRPLVRLALPSGKPGLESGG